MRNLFLQLSSDLTGFSAAELEGTGLVDTYQSLIESVLGPALSAKFHALAEVVTTGDEATRTQQITTQLVPDAVFWPVAESLVRLWYLGSWKALPDQWYAAQNLPPPKAGDSGASHVPSGASYVEQLSYRAAGAHPPGAKATGYGSWSLPPVF